MTTESGPAFGERFHVILVEPEIAGNVGAIGRTCVATGAMLWLVRPLGFLLTDRHIKRAGLDYWPHLEWKVVDDLDEVAKILGPERLWLFSTRGTTSYTSVRFALGDALVFGPESRGLPASLLDAWPGRSLRIPIRPEARSLNLSNSAAVAVFEAVRQHEANDLRPKGSGRV
jgi:tRNA (cytidine/uridine-2'-O-)-methyltransferase